MVTHKKRSHISVGYVMLNVLGKISYKHILYDITHTKPCLWNYIFSLNAFRREAMQMPHEKKHTCVTYVMMHPQIKFVYGNI
ncbi:hypothetical protein MAR_002836 [Mya arenaria]|uniref:Uncharacterized protein n=1 Tax=Mya arenaria TaxID=6604 RepID=A0ABY7G494_MYAAR|nr:hypothetical protein MAR_002836 [Mya arenaria]